MKHISKNITLKHLMVDQQKMIGLQFYPDKVIQALIKELPNPRWSNQYGMVYIVNTKRNLDLIFNKFKGVAWINTNTFFKDKPLSNDNKAIDINYYRNRENSDNFRFCPDTYLLKLELKKYAPNTVRAYVNAFEIFINYHKTKPLIEINENDIRQYLQYMINNNKSDSAINIAVNSIKFYFEIVLDMPNRFYQIERPRKKEKLPVVISKQEVKSMIDLTTNIKHRAIISLLYSSGMRRGELLNLKLTDIDSKRMLIKIHDAKGGKSRITLLSKNILDELRTYFKEYHPKTYLFEGQKGGKYGANSTLKLVKMAAKRANIETEVTPHVLRHSFATHLIESGTSIRFIQQLLGHNSIKTTEIYTNVSTTYFNEIKNPLDEL